MNFEAATIDHDCDHCGQPRLEHGIDGNCPGQVMYCPGQVTYEVAIKEVHEVTMTVSLPEGASRDEICAAAMAAHGNAASLPLEYCDTLPNDKWTVRTESGDYV